MSIVEALLLGVVQGISEFLPISSSGHLVLVRYFLGMGDALPLYVGIATNTGTLLAVLVAFWHDVKQVLLGLVYGVQHFLLGRFLKPSKPSDLSPALQQERHTAWRLAGLVLVGSVPTAIIGLTTEPFFEQLAVPVPTALALIVTGTVLWFAPTTDHRGNEHATTTVLKDDPTAVGWWMMVCVGMLQGFAVMPGISRAGITIAGMLALGLSSRLAAQLSFLMYLVVSFGVMLLGIPDIVQANIEVAPLVLLIGVSFAVGYGALQLLFRILRRGQLRRFSPYLWTVAVLVLVRVATVGQT